MGWGTVGAIQESPAAPPGAQKFLPPGGHPRVASLALRAIHLQVARVSGSEEECGRKSESPHNLSDLLLGWKSYL